MSYWTDWYIADEADATQIADDNPGELPRLTLDSIIQTDLDDLAELLGAEYIVAMDILNEDPMIIIVPQSFVVALANLADDAISDTAEKWAAGDEMGIRAAAPLRAFLKSMRKLCSECLAADKKIIERAA